MADEVKEHDQENGGHTQHDGAAKSGGPVGEQEPTSSSSSGGGGSKKKLRKKKGGKGGAAGGGGGGDDGEEAAAQQQVVESMLAGLKLAGGGVGATADAAAAEGGKSGTSATPSSLTQGQVQDMLAAHYRRGHPGQNKTQADYKFWSTQPVPKLDDKPEEHGPIDELKDPTQVRQEPLKLPEGFEWCEVDIMDTRQCEEVYDLLNKNYVEDDDNMFRFDYSSAFLRWALTPPGSSKDFVVGIRSAKNHKLLAFITGVPIVIKVYEHQMPMVEINFLCVHKKLRSRRLAPVLIKEITRRVNVTNIWQAVYTAGVVLPKPVARCRYYHRLLNPKKLIDIGFTRLGPRMTLQMTLKLHKLPEAPKTSLRPMTRADVPSALELLNTYLADFTLKPIMDEEDLAHWLLPREGVVNSFVIEKDGKVTDLCSFYHLPSSVLNHDKHSKLHAVYSFYNVATTVDLKVLMLDCLVLASCMEVDVFNALDIMENKGIFTDLKFGPGDGHLQYYVFNWKCPDIPPDKVGFVLL